MKNLMTLSGIRDNFEFDYFEEFKDEDPSFAFNGEALLSTGVHIYDDEPTQKAWQKYMIKILAEVLQEIILLNPGEESEQMTGDLKALLEEIENG